MKTTTTLVLGLMAALVVLAPTAAASDSGQEETTDECLPVWIDSQGNPHYDPSCVPAGLKDGPA